MDNETVQSEAVAAETEAAAVPTDTTAESETAAAAPEQEAAPASSAKAPEAAAHTDAPAAEKRPYRQNNMRGRRKKVCTFCTEKTAVIDYKDALKLRKFTSERGKILPRRVSGTCAKHQRELTTAIKRARVIALLPYVTD